VVRFDSDYVSMTIGFLSYLSSEINIYFNCVVLKLFF